MLFCDVSFFFGLLCGPLVRPEKQVPPSDLKDFHRLSIYDKTPLWKIRRLRQ